VQPIENVPCPFPVGGRGPFRTGWAALDGRHANVVARRSSCLLHGPRSAGGLLEPHERSATALGVGRLRPDRPNDPTSACQRCHRPALPLDEPAALYWELIPGDEHGEIVGVFCPGCLTLREQRAIRAGKARVHRRLKRGLPSS
jgi:hypothetical protein